MPAAILAAEKPFGVDVLQVVATALEQVAAQPEPASWGTDHVVVPLTPHQQLGLPAPAGTAPPSVPLAGDDDCVLATGRSVAPAPASTVPSPAGSGTWPATAAGSSRSARPVTRVSRTTTTSKPSGPPAAPFA
ncbi:hypothetical protein GCM10023066_56170 [Nocardioides kongjuensis]